MSEEILINASAQETRIAVVENGTLQELYIDRLGHRGIVGNIYKGKVTRVLPGMHAAFVDIGLKRAAFIHASDILGFSEDTPDITKLVYQGQELIVQVVKDPLGTKGARLTTHISLPSHYLVYMPHSSSMGISKRIEDVAERERLEKLLLDAGVKKDEGFVVRTNAEGVDDVDFKTDINFLRKLWKITQERVAEAKPANVVYEDLPLCVRVLRDQVNLNVDCIRVDEKSSFHRLETFAKKFMPNLKGRVEHLKSDKPIFDLYGIEDEIVRALSPKAMLKSGGYLIIEQTEAMTTVDVNTGAFVGSGNLEETVLKTNLEAAQTIARQLRLRNLGGAIIIDFIDMPQGGHRREVLRTLGKALARDPVKTRVYGFSALGLVEMTRKRTRESLQHVLCEPCSPCSGIGYIKQTEAVDQLDVVML